MLALLVALGASQCRGKDDFVIGPLDYLPPPTHVGEDVVGCLMNGEARVTIRVSDAKATYRISYLQMSADFDLDSGEQSLDVTLQLEPDTQVERSYDLTDKVHDTNFYTRGAGIPDCRYEESSVLFRQRANYVSGRCRPDRGGYV